MLSDAVQVVLIVGVLAGVVYGLVRWGQRDYQKQVRREEACARICGTSRSVLCEEIRDVSWPQPKYVAVCLASEGLKVGAETLGDR